ncbi:MAG: hypothetical protein MO853_05350 [Candidatus Protistobacter heckmanni]|nr:hypothetical protein [Candidatus Protistobacter heckmanni]
MGNLYLTLAIGDYDHTRDLALGRVRPDGIDLTVLNNNVEEIFFRFFDALEWEVSEISMGMYVSRLSRGDTSMIAIPVFPSRGFCHSAIYVRADVPIAKPQDLRGKRIGLPQWSQTTTIYIKGYIAETLGIPLGGIQWVQGGVNQAGRDEWTTLRLPEWICLSVERECSLNDMLLAGEIDALISARVGGLRAGRSPGSASVPRQPRGGGGVFRLLQHLPDHAYRRDPPRRLRSQPLDRPQSHARPEQSEEPQRRAPVRCHRLRGSGALGRRSRAAGIGRPCVQGRRALALRRGVQP